MMPSENSTDGRVADLHHLLPTSGLYIIGEHFVPVSINLWGVPGATLEAVKTAQSHPVLLGQVRRFLARHGIEVVIGADTAGSAKQVAEAADPARAAHLAQALGLTPHLAKYPETLSGGQQQRVAIARTLMAQPKLVLADEPTGNLDEATASDVLDQMLNLVRETGAALMVVTHSASVAARMDRQLHLSRGRLA